MLRSLMKGRHKGTHANHQRIKTQDEAAVAEKFQEELMGAPIGMNAVQAGKVFESDNLLDQELEYVSDGIDDAGNEYKLYLGRVSRSPVIKNPRTGHCFILPWADVIRLAEAAGLNR